MSGGPENKFWNADHNPPLPLTQASPATSQASTLPSQGAWNPNLKSKTGLQNIFYIFCLWPHNFWEFNSDRNVMKNKKEKPKTDWLNTSKKCFIECDLLRVYMAEFHLVNHLIYFNNFKWAYLFVLL